MNTIWNNQRLKQLRQLFQTDFSAKITSALALTTPARQTSSSIKTHVVPPSMFRFLINQHTPQAPVQRSFKQSVITNVIKTRLSADKMDKKAVQGFENRTDLPVLDTVSEQLRVDDLALNEELTQWFDEQLTTSNKDAIVLSMLNHDLQSPITEKVIALLPEFSFTETQCKGLGHLLLRTGPQGVLICLQALQRMKKNPEMFEVFNKTCLQSGDYCQFMSPAGQNHLDYFTQLRGSKLTWWNTLVAQHLAAGHQVDFNDLFGAYRFFLTELEGMGLYNLPSNCPFASINEVKASLERALEIIKHVNPADRSFQLMALDGLDFGPNSAYFAMRQDEFKWVSKEMDCIRQDNSTLEPFSYGVDAALYYEQVFGASSDVFFYRYLGQHKPASTREIYDGFKKQIDESQWVQLPEEQAKLLYMLVMTKLGEEPDHDLSDFLKALNAASESAASLSASDIITSLFVSFKGLSADSINFSRLTQILRVLAGLSYTAPETLLTCLPKLFSLAQLDDSLFAILLNRHTALMANENESTHFLSLINVLTSVRLQFADDTVETVQFLKILSLLSEEISPQSATMIANSLHQLEASHRTAILSLLSAINMDKSTNLSSFTLDKFNHILAQLAAPGASRFKEDDVASLITVELPHLKIGDKEDEPSTFTIADCTKEYITEHSPVAGLKNSVFSYLATPIEDMINSTLSRSGDELFSKLNEIEQTLKGIIKGFGPILPVSTIKGMMKTDEEKKLVGDYLESTSMKVYIPFVFLNRFKKALNRSVQSLQTGQPTLDEFLMTALDRVPINESDPFGTAIQQYNTQFEAAKLFTNTLLQIKNRNNADYNQCVEILNDPTTWAQIGLGNMALLLQGLTEPVSVQLKSALSTISSIGTASTEIQLNAAIKDLSLLAESKADLGDGTYQVLLEQTIRHDLTQTTSFPLAALIGFKQGNMAGMDSQQADALFRSVLRIINISPPDEPEIMIALIGKTTRLINQYAQEMPNILPFLTIELEAIATAADHREVLKASSVSSKTEINWWFLLSMFSTIVSAITLLWVMICAYWNPPPPPPVEEDKTTEELKNALNNYNASLDVIEKGMAQHSEAFPEIKGLFSFWPYPSLTAFANFFKEEHDVKADIQSFDQDPFSKRAQPGALQYQRTIDRVEDVIHEMSHLLQNESFSELDQNELARQFMYVNTIGTDPLYPLVVGELRCENLASAGRSELHALSTALISALRTNPSLSILQEEALTLQLLAVMREGYYRSTGIFPYSTQMLSVLVSLKYPGNLMLQINTGEGKSTTTAILAGLQCVLGGSVHERQNKARTQLVCTGNATLVEQGYAESHHFFNDFLGIPSSVINQVDSDTSKTSTSSNQLAIGGITYTTVQALSFYKQREKRAGRSFTHDDEGHPLGMDCTFDECDSAFLDDYTQLSLVVPMLENGSEVSNPYAWIFPLVNEFVADVGTSGPSLRDFIENHTLTTTSQRLQLLSISDSKLEQFLDAALDVVDYQDGLDFVVLEEEKRSIKGIERIMSIVTPLNRSGAPQRGSSFPNYRQEMLQAKMQQLTLKKHAPMGSNQYFPIDPEVEVVDQESVKSLIDGLAKQGRIIGLSGTLGNTDELRELASTYDVHAVKIPPHQKNRREISTPQLSQTHNKQDYDLQLIIDKGKDQPLLVVCKSILEVEALCLKLVKKYPGRVQKITGKESESEMIQYKDRAGINGMITIGTPLMGRGVDFKTTYPKGFHLHQRFIDAQRETEQVMGRVARNGQLGNYSASYVIDGVPFQYGFSYFGLDQTVAMQQLKEQQKKITQDAATVRHYIQAFDAIQQVTLQQFDACKKQLLETHPLDSESLESRLSALRTLLIEKLDAAWKSGLPKGDNPNPYLNDKQRLNSALKTFEKDTIPELWKETHSELLVMDEGSMGSRLTWFADIKQALNVRKLNEKREKKQIKMSAKQAHERLQSALDPAGAVLCYSAPTLTPSEVELLKNASDKIQVLYLFNDVNAMMGSSKIEFDEKKTTVENLATVINTLASSFSSWSIDQQYRLHATIAQAVQYYHRSDYAACQALLDSPIEALEQKAMNSLHHVLAIELEKRLSWAKPDQQGVDYWVERPNVRKAADELYPWVVELKDRADPALLSHLYQRLYYYQQLFKDELTNYVPWGHGDIRVLIDDALRHINELKRVEAVDETLFQAARNQALSLLYFKAFNAEVNKISLSHPSHQEWKAIAEKIKDIQVNPSLSILHDLKHCLSQMETFQLSPSSNNSHYFFSPAPYYPVQGLLKELEVIRCKIQQLAPEFSSDDTYLSAKATTLSDLFSKAGMGSVRSLTITPKHSGVGEYFELRIEGADKPELFEQDDVVRYESNATQLKDEKLRLERLHGEQQQKIVICYDLMHQLATLEPEDVPVLTSDIPEFQQEINALNAVLTSWLAVKERTLFSSIFSYFGQYPFSEEITQQIEGLYSRVKKTKEGVTQQADGLSKEIGFFTRVIEEKGRVDEAVMIKPFQSIDELLTYEDKLRERANGAYRPEI